MCRRTSHTKWKPTPQAWADALLGETSSTSKLSRDGQSAEPNTADEDMDDDGLRGVLYEVDLDSSSDYFDDLSARSDVPEDRPILEPHVVVYDDAIVPTDRPTREQLYRL